MTDIPLYGSGEDQDALLARGSRRSRVSDAGDPSNRSDRDEGSGGADSDHARRLPSVIVVLGLILYGVVGALSAVYEILLIPFRVGGTLVPIAVVLAIASNIVLPRLSRNLTGGTVIGSLPPVILWVVATAVLQSSQPEGDVLVPGGGNVQWVSYGVMLGGLFAGLLSALLAPGAPRSLRSPGGRR
jgi:hypothetical protein